MSSFFLVRFFNGKTTAVVRSFQKHSANPQQMNMEGRLTEQIHSVSPISFDRFEEWPLLDRAVCCS